MPKPNIQGAISHLGGSSATSLVPYPAGIVAGELLLLCVTRLTNGAITDPDGWDRLDRTVVGSENQTMFYTRIADGSETGNISIVDTKANRWYGACLRTDAKRVVVHKTLATSNSTTSNSPAVSSDSPNCLALHFGTAGDTYLGDEDIANFVVPATEVAEGRYPTSGKASYLAIAEVDMPVAGPVPIVTFSSTGVYERIVNTIVLSGTDIASISDNNLGKSGETVHIDTVGMVAVTQAALKSGSFSMNLPAPVASGNGYDVTLPTIEDITAQTAGVPFTSANHEISLEVSDGSDIARKVFTFLPADGWDTVDVVGAVVADGTVSNQVYADDSQVLFTNCTILPDTSIETDKLIAKGVLFDVATGKWEGWIWKTDLVIPGVTVVIRDKITAAGGTAREGMPVLVIGVAGMDAITSAIFGGKNIPDIVHIDDQHLSFIIPVGIGLPSGDQDLELLP